MKQVFRLLAILLILAGLVGWVYFILNNKEEIHEPVSGVIVEMPEPVTYELSEASLHVIGVVEDIEADVKTCMQIESLMDVNQEVMAIIRGQRYGSLTEGIGSYVWESFAGPLSDTYKNLFEIDDEILSWLNGIGGFYTPISQDEVDFIHMIAVIDIYLSETGNDPIIEPYYDYLMSWGGDLETFGYDMRAYAESLDTYDLEVLEAYAEETMGSDQPSYFSKADWLADIDGVNIANYMLTQEKLLSEAIYEYYHTGLFLERYLLFVDSFGGEENFKLAVESFVYAETYETDDEDIVELFEDLSQLKELMHMFLFDKQEDLTDSERRILVDVMINKVLE